jgi:DNA-binding GntR family transcriptional regulator
LTSAILGFVTNGSTTRADLIYERLRIDILNGRHVPGAKLPFAELAVRYGVSTGVLREVLPRLVEQGLVLAEPQRGFRVKPVSEKDLEHLTEARVAIETLVLRLSIEQGDVGWESDLLSANHRLARTPLVTTRGEFNDTWLTLHSNFHRTLLSGAGNPYLFKIAMSLRDATELYRCWAAAAGDDGRDGVAEHQGLVDASLARDADRAVARLTEHIELSSRQLLRTARTLSAAAADPPEESP